MVRVVVVGARRRRQGIGEYVARYFFEAGAEVCAIVGTSRESVSEARRTLSERYALNCEGYTCLEHALASERPEIAAICTPYRFHREQLNAVARAGVHCLCEKPLWWEPAADREAETARLVAEFDRRGLYLAQVTQWPYTLPTYYELYPAAKAQAVERFEMRLSPVSSGAAMVPDAAPHVISMLQSLVGIGRVVSPRAEFFAEESSALLMEFDYLHARGPTAVRAHFCRVAEPPRPASYAINGMRALRRIEMPGYVISFHAGGRVRTVEDPLRLLVEDFLARVRRGARVDCEALVSSVQALQILTRVAEQGEVRGA